MHDVFISFSFEDKEIVDKIVNELTNIYQIPCWICTAEVRAGGKFYDEIVKAIDECKILLFVQTESSVRSNEVKDEIFEALANEKTIVPFVIDNSVLERTVNFKLRNMLAIKATEPPIENRIAELAEELCRILSRPFLINGQTEKALKADGLKSIMPLNNYNFIGRYDEMELLKSYLESDRVVILHGFGGSGKTEIAKKYVFENKLKYDAIIFTNYTSTLTDILISDKYFCFENITRISQEGNQPESDESYARRKLAELKKRSTENTLIIVDNFDTLNDDLLSDFLDGPYKLIFTTRTNFDFLGVPMVEITALNPEEQMQLFIKNYKLRITDDIKETVKEIIAEIGGHTLTLELIAKLMYIRRIKPSEMLIKLKKHGVSDEIEGKVQHGLSKADSVYSHIRTLFRLETLSESERSILNNLSLLPFAGVQFDDFLNWSGLENTEEIFNLINCGFIRYDEENDVLSLHPVVSDIVNNDESFDIKSCQELIKNLTDIFSTTYNMERSVRIEYGEIAKFMSRRIRFDKDNIPVCKEILNILMDLNYNSMFEELLEQMHSVTGEEDSEDYGWYCYKVGDFKLRNMNYDEAIENLQKSIEIYSRVSPKSKILAYVIKHLAHTYHAVFLHVEKNTELLEKAKQCLKESGEIYEKCAEPVSDDMGSQYYATALNYYYFGDYEPALEYAQKSYEIFMEIGGEVNSHTTAPMRVLARIYSKIGMFEEAVSMQNRVIKARKKLWGENNFIYIEQYETLADIYFDNGMKEKGMEQLNYVLSLIDNDENLKLYADKINQRISDISAEKEQTMNRNYSILYPDFEGVEYKKLSETVCHDLALDSLCQKITDDNREYKIIMETLSNVTKDQRVAEYRQKVFSDILRFPKLRKMMLELFDKFDFIRNYGVLKRPSDEKIGIWHLLRRLDELDDYITSVEAMQKCLTENDVQSEGLKGFKEYVDKLYHDAGFDGMKKDIKELKNKSSEIKSVTVGINVNERFEATGLGLVSVNNKPFKKSGLVSNFADAISKGEKIHDGTDWNGDMHFHPVEKNPDSEGAILEFMGKRAKLGLAGMVGLGGGSVSGETMAKIAEGDGTANSTFYLSGILNKMLDMLLKKLRDTLGKYSDVVVVNISRMIPEFIYYIRFAEFIESLAEKGYSFCEPEAISDGNMYMEAKNFYNLKLAFSDVKKESIVTNDLNFDKEHTVYILTGANRGGKTTVTQAVGIMFVLAQGGISVPCESFSYKPVDNIFTHFPADEDKTLDLGRLGEECKRFKEDYSECSKDSLYLLNETFSTTSFEEGYYIAKDAIRALLKKSVRTIYNTHMHKLGAEADELNGENKDAKASSLIVRTDGKNRSFKIEVAPPEGLSYAKDIAEKYGVTYEMLTESID